MTGGNIQRRWRLPPRNMAKLGLDPAKLGFSDKAENAGNGGENNIGDLKGSPKSSLKSSPKSSLNATDAKIADFIAQGGRITIPILQDVTGLTRGGGRKALRRLREADVIQRIGPARGGHWGLCRKGEEEEP